MYVRRIKKKLSDAEKSDRDDKRISWTIILQFCMIITNYTVKEVFQINNSDMRSFISFIFMILIGIMYLKNLRIVFKRISMFFIFSYIFFMCLFLLSPLLNPETIEFLPNIAFWLFIICLPTAQYYLAIREKSIFLNMLILSGYYQLFLGLVIFISMILTTPTYDMVFSYLILVPMVILTYKLLFINFRIIDVALILLASISVVTVGSRGPLLSYFIYLVLLFVNYLIKNRLKAKALVLFLLSTTFISAIVLNFNFFIKQLNNLLIKYGIQSRTIYLLLSDNIDFSTGRSEIFSNTINNIFLNPVLGYGIGGDRVFLNGTYPHNIFLEIIAQFGIVLGGIFSLVLIMYWFIGIFLNKNTIDQHLAIIFAGLGLISLFFSGSYLTSSNFWLFMAICISSVHFTKHKLSYINSEKLITEKDVQNEKENNF